MRNTTINPIYFQSNLLTALEPPIVLKSEAFARNYENREEVLEAADLTAVPSIEAPCITVCVQDISLYQSNSVANNGQEKPSAAAEQGCDLNRGAGVADQERTSQPCCASPNRAAAGRQAPLLLRDCSAP